MRARSLSLTGAWEGDRPGEAELEGTEAEAADLAGELPSRENVSDLRVENTDLKVSRRGANGDTGTAAWPSEEAEAAEVDCEVEDEDEDITEQET